MRFEFNKHLFDNFRNPFRDLSVWILLLSNIATIYFTVTENWGLGTVLWVYWFQSVIIGIFNFIRILQLKEFSSEGVYINKHAVEPTQGTKHYIAFFFLFHYGFFHLVYFFAILGGKFAAPVGNDGGGNGIKYILAMALLFFINHLFSYLYNRPRDTKKQNIGTLMFYPYARIIPMHLVLVFAPGGALFYFLLLKTGADIIMHLVEHYVLRKGEEPQS